MIVTWLVMATLISLALHAGFGVWGAEDRLEDCDDGLPGSPFAIVVPARNERGRIGKCVRAALAVEGCSRVVVVDDGSTDGTADEAMVAAGGDLRFEVRAASARPVGWSGKAWACSEGVKEASEQWVLFVDADVVLHPHSGARAVVRATSEGASILSLFGSWELVSFWERVMIPAIGWFIRGSLDLRIINGRRNTPGRRAFANGQFILVRRLAYEALGGHGAVRGDVLDDVGLAEAFASSGHVGRLYWAPWAFRVRLYESLPAILQGYRKNLYAGMGRRPALALLAVVLVLAVGVAPLLAAPTLLWSGHRELAAWSLALALSSMALRFRTERRDGRFGAIAGCEPLAQAILGWVLALSWLNTRARWKGRSFTHGRVGQ